MNRAGARTENGVRQTSKRYAVSLRPAGVTRPPPAQGSSVRLKARPRATPKEAIQLFGGEPKQNESPGARNAAERERSRSEANTGRSLRLRASSAIPKGIAGLARWACGPPSERAARNPKTKTRLLRFAELPALSPKARKHLGGMGGSPNPTDGMFISPRRLQPA